VGVGRERSWGRGQFALCGYTDVSGFWSGLADEWGVCPVAQFELESEFAVRAISGLRAVAFVP
jgi:hypothetical protein